MPNLLILILKTLMEFTDDVASSEWVHISEYLDQI